MPDYAVSTAFTAKNKISPAFDAMGRGADRFGNKASSAFKKASRQGSRFGDVVKGILTAGAITGGARALFGGLRQVMQGIVSEASNLENAVADFSTLTGSVENATRVVNDLNAAAAATPFEFGDLAKATKTLMGFEAVTQQDLIPTLKMLGDTAGGSADRFNGITLAFSQIQAQGKASMQDINQLINNGIPILGQLAKQWGVTVGEAREMTSQGRATGVEVTKAFRTMTSEGGKFFKGMETASQTFSGRTSTLVDNIKLAGASIGTALLPQLKAGQDLLISIAERVRAWADANQEVIKMRFESFIKTTTTALRGFWVGATRVYLALAPFLPLLPYLIGGFVIFKTIMAGIGIAQAVISFLQFLSILRSMVGVMGILNAVLMANPVGLIVGAISALIVGLIYLEKRFGLLSKGWEMLKIAFVAALGFMKTAFMTFAAFYLNLWTSIIAVILKAASKIGGAVGLDTSGLDTMISKMEKFRDEVNANTFGAEAPNSKEAEARRIQFQGKIDITGAPPGTAVESKTTGAPPISFNALGANP